jgi:cytochrome P450
MRPQMVTATNEPVRLPPRSRSPKFVQAMRFWAANHGMFAAVGRRYRSRVISVNLPRNDHAVVISDPVLAKELFTASTDLLERPTSGAGTLGEVFGPGSTFSRAGDDLIAHRKLVLPMFHGKRMRSYEHIIEEEVMREVLAWPQGGECEALEAMTRIALNSILRAVFGAEGPALDKLRDVVLPMVPLGGLGLVLPPWTRRDLGRWTPWGRYMWYRRRFDAIVDSLIAGARADPAFEQRSDVLSLLLHARYENGEPITDRCIADELLTLLASGHETTASSLAWTIERLIRHPQLLSRLVEEVDTGGSDLREATIWEVLRIRPVLDGAMRRTKTRIRLRDWIIPEGTNLIISIRLTHDAEDSFPDAGSFNPDRFVGAPKPSAWIPFGGGVNRCVGAAFAHMEMDVALRTLLRELRFEPTAAPDERGRWRGVATVPARGARVVAYRRRDSPSASSRSNT